MTVTKPQAQMLATLACDSRPTGALTRWPSIVQLAADYAAAITEAATALGWQEPLRRRYGDLLLTLMTRPKIRDDRAQMDNLFDRFERLMVASEGDE